MTFAIDCHALADRAQIIMRDNANLRPHEKHVLRSLIESAHAAGDNAECAPELYQESQA